MPETVFAYCELKGRQWVILRCPICGKRHYHGAGGAKDDPMQFLGGRVPHCALPLSQCPGNYELTTDRALQP
jgi:hypothetical protein